MMMMIMILIVAQEEMFEEKRTQTFAECLIYIKLER